MKQDQTGGPGRNWSADTPGDGDLRKGFTPAPRVHCMACSHVGEPTPAPALAFPWRCASCGSSSLALDGRGGL
jgi:hypothetical protein